jgi:transposase-like protein
MMGSKHLIRADIKAQILKRLKEEGVPVVKLAEEHGINPRTIYGWLSKGVVKERPSLLEYAKLKKENQQLKELVGNLTYQVELEKKKTAR